MENYINIYFNWQVGFLITFGKAVIPRKRYITIEIPLLTIQLYLCKY